MKRTLRLPHRDLKATLDHDLSLPVPSMTDSAPHDGRSGRGLHDEAAVLQAVARGGQNPAATPVAQLISGEVINCDFNRVLNAGDARRRIATILGKAVASVDISVAGNVLEDSDSLDGLNMEIRVNVVVNCLTHLPQSIVHLEWLQCLYLEWNQLEELPAGFGQLVRLRELHLRGNRIVALPDGFGDLLRLEVPETEGNYPKLTVPQVPPRLNRVTF